MKITLSIPSFAYFGVFFCLCLLVIACRPEFDAQRTEPETPRQKWTWTEDEFNAVVRKVRAGRDLTPEAWPGGARVAVLLSFDVDNETIAWWDGEPSITDLSRGEYGARVGLRRVVDLLEKHEWAFSLRAL